MARHNFKTFTLRVPEELIGKLRIKAGQLSAERGEYVSLNALMLELLEKSKKNAESREELKKLIEQGKIWGKKKEKKGG